MNRKSTIAAAALVFCTIAGSASARDSLSSRAVNALGVAIAAQGNAALVQIRRELRDSAREAMKPFLPEQEQASEQPQPARTPAAQQ